MTSKLPPAIWRDMTADERRMANAAREIRFPFGAGQGKGIVSKLGRIANSANPQISDRQAKALRAVVSRYRRQLPADVVALAEARS